LQLQQHFLALDAFSHYLQTEFVGQVDNQFNDFDVIVVAFHILDKRLVNFDFVSRNALEIGQRRKTGAKVIKGDFYAQLAQLRQVLEAQFVVFDQGAFGNFQGKALR